MGERHPIAIGWERRNEAIYWRNWTKRKEIGDKKIGDKEPGTKSQINSLSKKNRFNHKDKVI